MSAVPSNRPIRSYGRTNSRRLSLKQKSLLRTLYPKLEVKPPDFRNNSTLLNHRLKFRLEIGFGAGEHLIGQAVRAPDTLFIGAETFIDGCVKLLDKINTSEEVDNIRLYMGDVRELLSWVPNDIFCHVDILFPDPWPKLRHQKRRLISPIFLDSIARVSKAGARIQFATDVSDYANKALHNFIVHPNYDWLAESRQDWQSAPDGHIQTRYEAKKLGDINPVYFAFKIVK